MGTFIITLPIPIVVHSFARSYNNLLWRGEVSQRRMGLINKMKRKKMMKNAMTGLINCTSTMMFRSSILPKVQTDENKPTDV